MCQNVRFVLPFCVGAHFVIPASRLRPTDEQESTAISLFFMCLPYFLTSLEIGV